MIRRSLLLLLGGPLAALAAPGDGGLQLPAPAEVDACVQDLVLTADADLDVGLLRTVCAEQLSSGLPAAAMTEAERGEASTALRRRLRLERVTQSNPFVLTPYRPNYVLPLAYQDSPNQASTQGNGLAQRMEVKFQLSFRIPLLQDVLGTQADLSIAYTGKSFWQAYDASRSRPFRETNHEPEIFLSVPVDWPWLGTRLDRVLLGINHQSNGQDLPTSRSWNRLYATFVWEVQDMLVSLQPWWRIPEERKKGPDDPRGDDNPDIERYAGQFELVVAWRNDNDTYSAVWRNNARAENRGSLELGWSFPMTGRARGYVQYFTGYAESLIDYQDHHNRISIGILMTDWL